MLVVVEDGDVADLFEPALNLKAARRGDILQVHAAEGAGNQADGFYDLVHVLALDAQGEGVHVAKLLEQHALALHHGHGGLGADVAQAEHGGAIRGHQAEVVAAGQFVAQIRGVLYRQAGRGHAGRIGQGEVFLRLHRHAGGDFNLALPLRVFAQGFLCVIHGSSLLLCSFERAGVENAHGRGFFIYIVHPAD